MKDIQTLVSIVIPCKNSARTISAALESIGSQTCPDIELIVVDNRSIDKTLEIIEQFKNTVNFPVHVVSGNFDNTPHARLTGAKKARGKYIFHVDSDMELAESVVSECLDEIKKEHGAIIIPERSFGEGYWTACKCLERSCYDNDDDVEAARFFPRELYFRLGGHNKKVLFAEDKDLDLRVRKAGHSVGRIKALIMHNEGEVELLNLIKKKYRYARTGLSYLRKHPKNLVRQSLLFRPAYFRNWKTLASKPHLTVGMFFMKSCEFAAMGISALINAKSNK